MPKRCKMEIEMGNWNDTLIKNTNVCLKSELKSMFLMKNNYKSNFSMGNI